MKLDFPSWQPALLAVLVGVVALAWWLRQRRLLLELAEEAQIGIIPGEHVRPLGIVFLRHRLRATWKRRAECSAYVRMARHLASRKAEMRAMNPARRQVAMIEVLRLRERLRRLREVETPVDGVVRSASSKRNGKLEGEP